MVVSAVDDRVNRYNYYCWKLVVISCSMVNFTYHWINYFVVDLFSDNRTAIISAARVRAILDSSKKSRYVLAFTKKGQVYI
jgi:hypothetical protein